MYKKAVVFAGTTEGKNIAEYLGKSGVDTIVCTATEYGGTRVKEGAYVRCVTGRMAQETMVEFLNQESPTITIDATHPYAAEVTQTIQTVCNSKKIPYLRIERISGAEVKEDIAAEDMLWVDSVPEAAEYLKSTEGKVLIATGSKELLAFTDAKDYKERYYARVLSLPGVVKDCSEMGFAPDHLFAMQGPFSTELNAALLKQIDASWFVTKESGKAGGFEEKYEGAKLAGARLLVIGRPKKPDGVTYLEAKKRLINIFQLTPDNEISLVGIGMGNTGTVTEEAKKVIEEAELIIGAERMLEAAAKVRNSGGYQSYCAYNPKEIAEYIKNHKEYEKIAIVLSGDVGFYSGAKKLMEQLSFHGKLIPGISSLPYFASKLKIPWEDIKCASLHGKQDNILYYVQKYERVFILLGEKKQLSELCETLISYGLGEVKVWLGERLGYEEEKISCERAKALVGIETESLSVCLIEYKGEEKGKSKRSVTYGIVDQEFIRDKVPMTKEEVRCIILSKLGLWEDGILYDVGAGTGSVSVEAGRILSRGRVYAAEKNPQAISLIYENCKKFQVSNVTPLEGSAPEVLEDVEAPTHVFIGGSSGNLKEIIGSVQKKNPNARVVISAVSMETVSEAFEVCTKLNPKDLDIVTISISKSKELGDYHMMMGQNPVTVFSFHL